MHKIIINREEFDDYVDNKSDSAKYYSVSKCAPDSYPCILIDVVWGDLKGDDWLSFEFIYVDDAIELINVKNQQEYLE